MGKGVPLLGGWIGAGAMFHPIFRTWKGDTVRYTEDSCPRAPTDMLLFARLKLAGESNGDTCCDMLAGAFALALSCAGIVPMNLRPG